MFDWLTKRKPIPTIVDYISDALYDEQKELIHNQMLSFHYEAKANGNRAAAEWLKGVRQGLDGREPPEPVVRTFEAGATPSEEAIQRTS